MPMFGAAAGKWPWVLAAALFTRVQIEFTAPARGTLNPKPVKANMPDEVHAYFAERKLFVCSTFGVSWHLSSGKGILAERL